MAAPGERGVCFCVVCWFVLSNAEAEELSRNKYVAYGTYVGGSGKREKGEEGKKAGKTDI